MAGSSRQYWSIGETKALLNIWADEHVQQQMEGVCRNEEVIQFIVNELAKLGILRTTTQIREKIKKLRQQYKAVKRDGGKSFPFFDVMDSVLRDRTDVLRERTDVLDADAMIQSADKSSATGSGDATIIRGTRVVLPKIKTLVKPEGRKRRSDGDATKEVVRAVAECHKQWLEKERELRREEWEREAQLRREEMQQEMALRREEGEREERLRYKEMEARSKDTETLSACLTHMAKLIAKDPTVSY